MEEVEEVEDERDIMTSQHSGGGAPIAGRQDAVGKSVPLRGGVGVSAVHRTG